MSAEGTPVGDAQAAQGISAQVEASKAEGSPSAGWGRYRERVVSAGLAFLLLALGLAAGPMTTEPRIPEPPNVVLPSALQSIALRDAAIEERPDAQATVRVAASLRRLVPPTAPIDAVESPVGTASHPSPEVEVTVDISDQRLSLVVDGVQTGYYKISTGLGRHWTPTGSFPPKWLNRHHRSSIYNNAPMPYAVFFNGNIALHGTNHIRKLGRPASKGCVRMHPSDARKIFNLIHRRGRDKVQITVQN